MIRRRILIVNNRVPYPLNDGGNIAVNEMIKTYHQAGMEVCLLAMNTSRHYIESARLSQLYKSIRFETIDIDNSLKPFTVLKNLVLSNKPNHADRFFHKSFLKKLEQVISGFRPDIIQVESIYLTEYLPQIKLCSKALLILRLHNIEYQVWKRLAEGTTNLVKRWYLQNLAGRLKKYEQDAWQQYDLLLPITTTDEKDVVQVVSSEKVLTIPVGVDVGGIPFGTVNEDWVGYHIGAMDWAPNADGISWFLSEVMPAILQEFPNFRFYFAGRNMPVAFAKFNSPNVTCAGEVADAIEFVRGKKILYVPLHAGGGIRVKVLEAMALQKVIISTEIGMQGIQATAGIHYLSANTAEEFLSRTNWVLSHTEEAAEMGKRGAEFVEKHYGKNSIDARLLHKLDMILA